MAKIIDFIAEAAKQGNNRPLELLIKQAEDEAVKNMWSVSPLKWNRNNIITDDPMKELTEIHRLAGFASRRAYFWQLSQMYQMDVNMIQHWALELGTENDFTLLIEKIHENWNPGIF
jgi:hypothetical protein